MDRGVWQCMNGVCSFFFSSSSSSPNSIEWKKGWPLKSGGFATLCHNCGTAYTQLIFCEIFHSEETGWRECISCGKRLHCGCIASIFLLELNDTGGVSCTGCSTKSPKYPPGTAPQEKTNARESSKQNGAPQNFNMMPSAQSGDYTEMLLSNINPLGIGRSNTNETLLQESMNNAQSVNESSLIVETNLTIGRLPASSNSNQLSLVIAEEKESKDAISFIQQGECSRLHHIAATAGLLETTNSSSRRRNTISPPIRRVARPPPVDGRVKNQLLPRYWPRITDQELQQISGDYSNSIIVPLFEKVLSASDAGRIGRLVLPKACAEAYFPSISQPEGIPLRIQDVKGKEWVFQFRFWPNNNSRMYVLEGVTPCIQSMQLLAGDTVTFSRMDPQGKLLMGFRKALSSISVHHQDSHSSSMNNSGGVFNNEPLLAATVENLYMMTSGYSSGLLQSFKGTKTTYNNNAIISPAHHIIEKNGPRIGDNLQLLLPERKRSRNIGPHSSRRLLMDGHDSLELKLSWNEVQDMLCSPPTVNKPTTIDVEDHKFEEFEEPPVFGKSSIFIVRLSGEQEQWAQCDSCFKWRKLPIGFLLPPKWTCKDNGVDDQTRSSCSAPDELSSLELENLLQKNNEFKKRRVETRLKSTPDYESKELETLPPNHTGDAREPGGSSIIAMTTKHPRHRPGCSCIVCIQPPSGKGKHKPTCTCNVCMTVKRRFKTLMMRKKKRQTEREAEIASAGGGMEESAVNEIRNQTTEQLNRLDIDKISESAESSKGKLDLNFGPGIEEHTMPSRVVSMMSLLHEASLPLDTYLRRHGLTSLLISELQSTSPSILAQAPPEEGMVDETGEDQDLSAAVAHDEHKVGIDELSGKDQASENDAS